MKLVEQILTKVHPTKSGWYNTDKGKLFWFVDEKEWSCRDDRISEEYPIFWYRDVPEVNRTVNWQPAVISKLTPGDVIKHISKNSKPFVVTCNYGTRVTAVASVDITNASEWEVLKK
jgi:hypothetical protein